MKIQRNLDTLHPVLIQITHKELLSQLMFNPWTGLFYWKIAKRGIQIYSIAGTLKDGYIQIRIKNVCYYAHRLAWLYVYGYFPENDIDHEDQIKHHNWILNLRESSKQCNSINTGNSKANKSGVKGVSKYNKEENKWRTQICVNQKVIHLGIFIDFDEAVCTRLAAEQCLNWSNYNGNSPAYQYVKTNIMGEAA